MSIDGVSVATEKRVEGGGERKSVCFGIGGR